MTATTAPPRVVGIHEWDADYAQREERWELVQGVPVMVPPETIRNLAAASALNAILRARLSKTRLVISQTAVHLPSPDGRGHTVRTPDLAVISRDVDTSAWRSEPSAVALVVEIVSSSSIETDWVTKRDEYAASGIPRYLVVDVRDEAPRLYLFDTVIDAGGGSAYALSEGDGERVTVVIDGRPITITSDDLD